MASVTFKRGTKAEIESTQIQDGQLLMETDQLNNNKIYLDLPNGTRVPVGGSGAWVGTKKEFEVAVEEGKIADGTQVIITDDYESGITASMTLYSNAQSGLVATNVQSAIDEVSAKIGQENISQVGNSVTGAINNLNSNLSLRPYTRTYYSGNTNQISITLTEKSRYGMLIFGGANGNSFFGAIDIESTGASECHAFLNGQLQGISVSNNGYVVTLDGLSNYGYYTVISPYKTM